MLQLWVEYTKLEIERFVFFIMTNILYIDSENSQSLALTQSFRNEGFTVYFAPSYALGLNIVNGKNFKPSIILCADKIDNLEGIEYLRQAKNYRLLRKTPVIIFTDNDSNTYSLRALIAGAVDVIYRSCEFNYLLAKLHAQSRIFSNTSGRTPRQKPNRSEKELLVKIYNELKNISKRISLGTTSFPEINSIIDKFSQYLSNRET